MPNYNKVIMAGHLTRDPALKYLPNNTACCEFGLAITEKWTGKDGKKSEKVCFVDCVCFGKVGELINQYINKGDPLLVEGKLEYQQWEKDGQKRSKHVVNVGSMTFLGDGKGGKQQAPEEKPHDRERMANEAAGPSANDDIPF